MSFKYNVAERANPSDREAPKKYYPSIVSSGRKSMRQTAARISQISTVKHARYDGRRGNRLVSP